MMNARMNVDMMEALRLTRCGQLQEATALIQRALGNARNSPPAARSSARRTNPITEEVTIDADFYMLDAEGPAPSTPRPDPARRRESKSRPSPRPTATAQERTAWPDIDLPALNERWLRFQDPLTVPTPTRTRELPDGAQFITGSYANAAGRRDYKLYVPSGYHGQALPLVVMLHGCTQDPDDFATGTRMNELAENEPCLVLYPAQTPAANGSKCWNWFMASDQQRDQGEPSIIAGMTRNVSQSHTVDPRRIYIAGLSAGGAMAATMAVCYPDLYAAAGIHSGLAHASARDLPSAFTAMQQGSPTPSGAPWPGPSGLQAFPTIVFHGDRDSTVHPCNGSQVIRQCTRPSSVHGVAAEADPLVTVENGQVGNGHAYTRTIHRQADGQPIAEHWLIHGAGHAWSGGNARGSYTDPKGPDAARQMLRFFFEHPRRGASE